MLTIYGITNCDTVKKARKWFTSRDIGYQFHDFRKDGLADYLVEKWVLKLGWEALVNKRSSSWRALDNRTKDRLSDDNVVSVLIEKPTLIKRPVVTYQNQLVIGFKEDQFAALLKQLQ